VYLSDKPAPISEATIDALDPPPGRASEMARNLQKCYETLIEKSWVGEDQLQLLEAWLEDLRMIGRDSGVAIGA
jgi:hypothetical protein